MQRGQQIGTCGASVGAQGDHLHFEFQILRAVKDTRQVLMSVIVVVDLGSLISQKIIYVVPLQLVCGNSHIALW